MKLISRITPNSGPSLKIQEQWGGGGAVENTNANPSPVLREAIEDIHPCFVLRTGSTNLG